ncbi:MAG: DoxX family protein [Bacteroidetes bacterium]|nr:DoxX family protein [Bacteroidota bacterium]
MFQKLIKTDHSKTTVLIRLMVGGVFLWEGIQKFLFPTIRGSGRFEKIGLPNPELLGDLVASFETISGLMILMGLYTRFATFPLIIIMLVAISTTKFPIFIDQGIWEMLHAARTDWSMLLGSIFLLIKGGGLWSFDKLFSSDDKESRT